MRRTTSFLVLLQVIWDIATKFLLCMQAVYNNKHLAYWKLELVPMSPNYLKEFYTWCSVIFFLPNPVFQYNTNNLLLPFVLDLLLGDVGEAFPVVAEGELVVRPVPVPREEPGVPYLLNSNT